MVGTTKTKLDGVNQEGFKVKGQVSDNVGPLPGVNVMVKGTMTGVITDMDGNFEIVAPYSKATLVFSYVGYQPKEVSLKGERIVNVKMVEDAKGTTFLSSTPLLPILTLPSTAKAQVVKQKSNPQVTFETRDNEFFLPIGSLQFCFCIFLCIALIVN